MSWKSIVCTGLLCVIASPVLADPILGVDLVRDLGGVPVLDPATGDWQWAVTVTPDASLFTTTDEGTGGSIAIEIGITASGAALTGATVNATSFPNENFGDSPYAFGENPADGLTIMGNQLFAALGSTFFTTADPQQVFTFTTAGPTEVNLTTSVLWEGAYGGNVRVAQGDDNFDDFSGTITKTVLAGDATFDGDVDFLGDFLRFQNNLSPVGAFKIWSEGDFDGNRLTNFFDFLILQNHLTDTPIPPPGGGAGAIEIPEPGTALLLMVGLMFAAGRRIQK
jgi:hypothetical protein